jgi:protein AbiQ|tara:strand:+ start:592 stop:1005 length:414 start_codon:yes stop_codon:yes gene_type:complete
MRFVLLRYDYLTQHPTIEALDKSRPHAIVLIEVNRLQFAIPLRTNLTHKHGLKTVKNGGLDYSKALLIFDQSDISRDIKLKSSEEFRAINEREAKIVKDFTKYVNRYVAARRKPDANIINREYLYSTLVNYHAHLGI